MGENISLWVGIVVGIVTFITSLAGALIFVNATVNSKIAEAIKVFADKQKLIDASCETDRDGITEEVQLLTNKNVLLDGELRSPTGIYPKILVIENKVDNIRHELKDLKRNYNGGQQG